MKIQDILLYLPRGVYTSIAKMVRTEISEAVKDQILQEGMYHFTPNEDIADQIIKSEYLKPTKSIVMSYGIPCAYMFAGCPDIDTYAKNAVSIHLNKNPYIHPNMVANAIKFFPKSKESLKHYKFRGLADGAILYEGYCILPHEQIKKVKMVPDLVRDKKGIPVRDENGEYRVSFREADLEEIIPGTNEYQAKEDYLNYMEEKAKKYGYTSKNRAITQINSVVDQVRMERDVTFQSVRKNGRDIFQNFFSRIKQPKIGPTVKEVLDSFSFSKKNPYRDKKFAKFVADLQAKQGITQLDLKELLTQFNKSPEAKFLAQKQERLEEKVPQKGVHGKEHSSRVALLAMMIAKKEGLLDTDINHRIKDILITASIEHDIGRILDVGPHAKRGAKKIAQEETSFLDGTPYTQKDKNLLMALVEAHEGSKNKIHKLLEKYNITEPQEVELAYKLNSILRDADALDRVRLDVTFPKYFVNLKPKFLENRTAKQLLNASYQLEFLTKQVKNRKDILEYQDNHDSKKRVERNIREEVKLDYMPSITRKNDRPKETSRVAQMEEEEK